MKVMALAAEKRRLRKMSSGIMGWLPRASTARNPPSAATPRTPRTTTVGSVHPWASPSVSAYVTPARPRAVSAAPARSSFWPRTAGLEVSGMRRAAQTTTAARGMLITKISRQETASTNQPPRKGPMAVETPASPDHAPMAAPRSSGSNTASRMARLPGVSRAAPTPWMARAAISISMVGAIAHSSDATANQTTPQTKTRRLPRWSPSDPPIRISPASVRA